MDSSFFTNNRKRLAEKLEPGGFVVLTAHGRMQRGNDAPFAYEQESNFWYLTGIEAPGWLLVMNLDKGEEWLVAPQLNRYQLDFEGQVHEGEVSKRSGVRTILSKQEGEAALGQLVATKKRVYGLKPLSRRIFGFQANDALRKLVNRVKGPEFVDIRPVLAKMRAIKQPAEVEALQAAVDVTVDGLLEVIRQLRDYKAENEIDAKLYYEFRRRGATHAFDPIITSGSKACVMHVEASNDPLKDWVLMDVGAKVNGYCADIARTIPIHRPTKRQIEVYGAVQRMHDYYLSVLKPGAPVKEVLMEQVYPFIGHEMVKLGLIKRPTLNDKNVFKFMPHAVTHGIGVDTHDPLGRPEVFEENMVLTDEVGTYIPGEGFGIRIENDVIITKDGARNMAARLPIDLEKLMKMIY